MTRVLLIDDDDDIVTMVTARLALDGYDFTVIDRDFEAACTPETFRAIDIVVLDLWLMPDGLRQDYPMAQRLMDSAKEANPLLPVILFSAVVGMHPAEALEAKADAVVRKPGLDKLMAFIGAMT